MSWRATVLFSLLFFCVQAAGAQAWSGITAGTNSNTGTFSLGSGVIFQYGSGTVNANEYKGGAASGTGGCSAGDYVVTLNDGAAPSCLAVSFTNVTGLLALAQLPLSSTTNGNHYLGCTVTSGVACAFNDTQAGLTATTVNGSTTSYQFAPSDEGTFVVHDKTATGTLNAPLPTPTSLGNPSYDSGLCNNSPQTDTITPAGGWTIALGNETATTSLSVAPGVCIRFFPDPHIGSQWDAIPSYTSNIEGVSAINGSGNLYVWSQDGFHFVALGNSSDTYLLATSAHNNGDNSSSEVTVFGQPAHASILDNSALTATAALTSGQVVKIDKANANSVVVATTTDTGAGVALGFVENSPGAGAQAYLALPGSVITDPKMGTGTCAIGNFVVVDTTTNGDLKCTATFTAGTILGRALTAQSTVGSAVQVLVWPQ